MRLRCAVVEAEMAAQVEEMNADVVDANDLFYPDEPLMPATSKTNKRSREGSDHHVVDDNDEDEYVLLQVRKFA